MGLGRGRVFVTTIPGAGALCARDTTGSTDTHTNRATLILGAHGIERRAHAMSLDLRGGGGSPQEGPPTPHPTPPAPGRPASNPPTRGG